MEGKEVLSWHFSLVCFALFFTICSLKMLPILTSVFKEKYIFDLMKCYILSMVGMIDKENSLNIIIITY